MLLANVERVLVQFKSEDGTSAGDPFDVSLNIGPHQLNLICNALLESQEPVPYAFYVQDLEVTDDLKKTLETSKLTSISEDVIDIVYAPQAIFKVRPVTRCSSSMPGHTEPVISAAFSLDGRHLASGSGDTTVRFWDVDTQTPKHCCRGHKSWVLCIAWSPDAKKLASACKAGLVIIWDPETGKQIGKDLCGHKSWVNQISWEPMHRSNNGECRRLASASKDTTVRVWDSVTGRTEFVLTGHTMSVTCIRWGGVGLIYTGSQDRTVKVWRAKDGALCRTLEGHGHWINTLALNTDYSIRTGPFSPKSSEHWKSLDTQKMVATAQKRYDAGRQEREVIVSGSDDFTMILWYPETDSKAVSRLTGHQQLINDVKFSPDTRLIASASFDKSIKIWNGRNGTFITALRGHVAPVYQISWSADSRLLVSGSADSTLKVWVITGAKDGQGVGGSKSLMQDLPGHADQVFALDWSPDGSAVASGGKDKVLKLWKS